MSVDEANEVVSKFQSSATPYSLLAFPFPPGHFRVHAFRGAERLSRPYAFDVTVTAPLLAEIDLERVALGQSAAFVMRATRVPRAIHGVVASVRSEGARSSLGAAQYRMRIVPRLALLRHARTSRIFQDTSVPDVVEQVLRGAGIATEWRLSRAYPERRYVTQYQESTLEFVERLLAEAGIFYAFAQPFSLLQKLQDVADDALAALGPLGAAGAALGNLALALVEREILVLGDDPSAYAPIDDGSALTAAITAAAAAGLPTEVDVGPVRVSMPSPTLSFQPRAGTSLDPWPQVTDFVVRHAVRANRAEFRDYDPERPQFGLVAAEPAAATQGVGVSIGGASVGVAVDVTVDPTKGVDVALDVSGALPQPDLEDYEHHGNFHFPAWSDVQAEAARILVARRRRAEIGVGASHCSSLAPGFRFELDEHPIASFDREYVVTRVRHRGALGSHETIYANDFECVRSDVLYPPKRRSHPHVQGAVTATVVGPAGEEVWVDGQGRIKVHFHWDRGGARDGQSSCWIRPMQAWGGAGWGTQFIPRVGMEVVVVFDGGDPDKPIVLGSLYNGTHPMPFAVPGDRTRSGIRTRTLHHSAGSNELSFEDAPGKEQLFVHAERDLDEIVKRDHTARIGNDERESVHRHRSAEVGGDDLLTVRGARNVVVVGPHTTRTEGPRCEVASADFDARVTGSRTTRIEQEDRLDVSGPAVLRYAGDLTTRVEGNQVCIVGRSDRQGSISQHVEGVLRSSATGVIELSSETGIVLRVGKSTLRLGADGIELDGAAISARGGKAALSASDDGLALRSDGSAQVTAADMVLKSSGATIALRDEARIDGSKVLLNSPDHADDPTPKPPEPPTRIELVDQDGAPIPNERFVVLLPDGSQRTGVLGADGCVELDLPSAGKIVFPDLPGTSSG